MAISKTIAVLGIEGIVVDVQVKIVKTIPSFVIVGMANRSINESKERIRGAFSSSNINLPNGKIIVNLSPADIIKEGASYDLAIALCILKEMGLYKNHDLEKTIVLGELSLFGKIVKTNDVVTTGLFCYQNDVKILTGIENLPILVPILKEKKHLIQVYENLNDVINGKQFIISEEILLKENLEDNKHEESKTIFGFDDVNGQKIAKRSAAIAISGGHNILFFGPPGSGKSLLCKSMEKIKIPLSHLDSIQVSSIYNSANLLRDNKLIKFAPFRAPHHSVSYAALLGGGGKFVPGEISLSHKGILLLDEIPEFNMQHLDMLRQVLQDKKITISRVNYNINMIADFQLVATANPCKCGYYQDLYYSCSCSYNSVQNYTKRFSGPLLDRIDIKVFMHSKDAYEENSQDKKYNFYKKILNCRKIQEKRLRQLKEIFPDIISFLNCDMKESYISYLNFSERSVNLIENWTKNNNLSHRRKIKVYGIARTIADFEDSQIVEDFHCLEAFFLSGKKDIV